MNDPIKLKGQYKIQVFNNKDEMKLISETNHKNVMTNEMYNHILNSVYHGSAQISTWYVGIFESDTTPSATTTYATPVFIECTAYTEATRPEFVESASSSQTLGNSANKATFTMNASKTIYGAFLVGGGSAPTTKGDKAGGGVMANAAKFATAQPAISGNVVTVEYIVSKA